MADTPIPELSFPGGCADCGRREVAPRPAPPPVGDDLDWLLRDYDGFRMFILAELAARFPERQRWTPADMEAVIVEALSVVLDQLSDMLDRVQAEAYLETARRPESVRRLLGFIGYDAIALAPAQANIPDPTGPVGELPDERRARLRPFHAALVRYADQYTAARDELTPTQQGYLDAYIANPDELSHPGETLAAVQRLLDNAPDLADRARHDALARHWTLRPEAMDTARAAGPRAVHTQKRIVTPEDYAERLDDHPLVRRAQALSRWSGSWITVEVAVMAYQHLPLDGALNAAALGDADALTALQSYVDAFNAAHSLAGPDWHGEPTVRTVLRPYIDAYRMAGQEVVLRDPVQVGIQIALSVTVADNYFQSETRRAVLETLGTGANGFFEPGRLAFGEDLYASDLIEAVMALDGVQAVCLNRFKRVGKRYPDQADSGRIHLRGIEVGVCDNDPLHPERGMIRLNLHGGQRG